MDYHGFFLQNYIFHPGHCGEHIFSDGKMSLNQDDIRFFCQGTISEQASETWDSPNSTLKTSGAVEIAKTNHS
jgi:hypothetical protein